LITRPEQLKPSSQKKTVSKLFAIGIIGSETAADYSKSL